LDQFSKKGFVFHELMTTDVEKAKEFYLKVIGLPASSGPYPILMDGAQMVAGLVGPRVEGAGWPSGGPGAHWIAYFGVSDVDAAAKITEELGGKILLPPTDVPGFGRAAVLKDPQGAAFGVFTPV
jgi:predicted enzyme related to lactoylglutathione lyase